MVLTVLLYLGSKKTFIISVSVTNICYASGSRKKMTKPGFIEKRDERILRYFQIYGFSVYFFTLFVHDVDIY